MADVSIPHDVSAADRGQMILIGGLTIAVAIVVLALLVNSAIYTQNVATRGIDAGGDEAIEYRNTVDSAVTSLVVSENNDRERPSATPIANVTVGMEELDRMFAENYLRTGANVDIERDAPGYTSNVSEGRWIVHDNDSRVFTGASGPGNWTPVSGAEGIRSYRMQLNGGSLASTTTPGADAFRVVVDDGAAEWKLFAYQEAGTTKLAVQNASDPSPTLDVCSPSTDPTIDLTNGTVDGSDCAALDFAAGVDAPYDLHYEYPARATGTYEFIANTTAVGDVNAGAASGSPYSLEGVYGVEINIVYETSSIRYHAHVSAVPGESDA